MASSSSGETVSLSRSVEDAGVGFFQEQAKNVDPIAISNKMMTKYLVIEIGVRFMKPLGYRDRKELPTIRGTLPSGRLSFCFFLARYFSIICRKVQDFSLANSFLSDKVALSVLYTREKAML